MKWFKHQTRSHNDEKLEEVMHQFGLEGYGFWWLLLELIGQEMDASDKCELSYPLKVWARKLRCTPRKTSTIFSIFSEKTLILMSYDNTNGVGKIKISVPNLLKFRDEYSKKSGQTPDKLPTDSGPKIIDTEVDKEEEKKKTKPLAAKKPPRPPSGENQIFIRWWTMAYEKVMEQPYLFTGKDAKHVQMILKTLGRQQAMARAISFFLSDEPFYDGKKDLGMFLSQINKLQAPDWKEHNSRLRELGIIPPAGVKFEEWEFWEKQ